VHDVAPLIALIDEPGRGVSEDGTYMLSEEQARAILELRLQRLTGLERDKIADELARSPTRYPTCSSTLADRPSCWASWRRAARDQGALRQSAPHDDRGQRVRVRHRGPDPARGDGRHVSMTGYVKRVPLSTYRAQRRGGKGRTGMTTKDEDVVSDLFVASTHAPVLFFTTRGIVHKLKVYRLPLSARRNRAARPSSTCCR
jgi:DNA gyrase subunit A